MIESEFYDNCRNSRREPKCQVREPVTFDGNIPEGEIMCVHLMCSDALRIGAAAVDQSDYEVRSVIGGGPEHLVVVGTHDKPTASVEEYEAIFPIQPEMVEKYRLAREIMISQSPNPQTASERRRYIGLDTGYCYSTKQNGDIAPNGQRKWLKQYSQGSTINVTKFERATILIMDREPERRFIDAKSGGASVSSWGEKINYFEINGRWTLRTHQLNEKGEACYERIVPSPGKPKPPRPDSSVPSPMKVAK